MKAFWSFFKRHFLEDKKEFYYLKEELKYEFEAEQHKVSFLTSYKNVG